MTTTINITDDIDFWLSSKSRLVPQHVNRISSLDDPCLRRLYYMRHDWDKAAKTSARLQGIFETGNQLEPVIERIVSEVGHAAKIPWRIVGSQMPTADALFKEYNISGSIDGFLQVQQAGQWVTEGVVDIKTMSPNIFRQVEDAEGLNKYPWTRRYKGQLMLYALGQNVQKCFLLLVNKADLYEMKLIEFDLDLAYCDELLAKAKKVNVAVAGNCPPNGINRPDECLACKFFSFCCPPLTMGETISIEDSEELETILDAMAEYKLTHKHYEELERERDGILKRFEGKDLLCGKWMVLWKSITINYKPKPALTVEQWRKKIINTQAAQKEQAASEEAEAI